MQMHDTLRQAQGASVVDELAAAFQIAPARAEAVMRAVMPELAWSLRQNTLCRGGLADLVEALGSGHHVEYLSAGNVFRDEAARRDGAAILGHMLGSKGRSRTLAMRAARQTGVSDRLIRSMLPGLAALTMGLLASRANGTMSEIVAQVPPQGRGNPHADLADILRRGCGAGRYAPLALRRNVRRAIARAAGLPGAGVLGWYVGFLGARAGARGLRMVRTRALTRT